MLAKARLQHVTIPAKNVSRLARFYSDVLGLETIARRFEDEDSNVRSRCLAIGDAELHLSEPRPQVVERLGGFDPISPGHFALRVEQVEPLVERLQQLGLRYARPPHWHIAGWQQVYFEDPDGNVVECHQVVK